MIYVNLSSALNRKVRAKNPLLFIYKPVVSNAEKPRNQVNKTIFEITKMDCPSEENLIRMKLDGISSIANLDFDIPNRKLTVFHSGEIDQIEKSVIELNLGGKKNLNGTNRPNGI